MIKVDCVEHFLCQARSGFIESLIKAFVALKIITGNNRAKEDFFDKSLLIYCSEMIVGESNSKRAFIGSSFCVKCVQWSTGLDAALVFAVFLSALQLIDWMIQSSGCWKTILKMN